MRLALTLKDDKINIADARGNMSTPAFRKNKCFLCSSMIEERLEVSIFKDLERSKNLISSVMRPDVEGGLGQLMFGVLPALEQRFSGDVVYTGKIRSTTGPLFPGDMSRVFAPEDDIYNKIEQSEENWDMRVVLARFALFGGSAYHIHGKNDAGRFAHVLPGVHDVDANAFITCMSARKNFELPFSRSSVTRLRRLGGPEKDVLDRKDSPVSFILSLIVSATRDHILEGVGRVPDGLVKG